MNKYLKPLFYAGAVSVLIWFFWVLSQSTPVLVTGTSTSPNNSSFVIVKTDMSVPTANAIDTTWRSLSKAVTPVQNDFFKAANSFNDSDDDDSSFDFGSRTSDDNDSWGSSSSSYDSGGWGGSSSSFDSGGWGGSSYSSSDSGSYSSSSSSSSDSGGW